MKRWLGATIAALALLASAGEPPTREADRDTQGRSVILITLDTTRRDRLGCYGYRGGTSPHLDRLAAEATVFTQAIASAAVTPVSHASILTGRQPYTHGLRVLHGRTENRLPEDEVTLAEILRAHGYRTGAFISAFPAGSRFGLDQGFATFEESYLESSADEIVSPTGIVNTGRNQRGAGETTSLALRWLAGAPEPYFLWIHYFDPHDPDILPPDDFLARFPRPTGTLEERLRTIYDLEIHYMDEQMGRVLTALQKRQEGRETVVAVVSDHGEGLGDHDWWTHGVLYQEQIHVPLVIRAPGPPRPSRVEDLVSTVDLAPTLLDLAGVRPPVRPPFEGRSLAPLMRGETLPAAHPAYADSINMLTYRFARGLVDDKDDMLFALLDGRWKYIHHLIHQQNSELYDLAADPGERHNLYRKHPEVARRMLEELRSRDFQPAASQGRDAMSPQDLERLRSLGYID